MRIVMHMPTKNVYVAEDDLPLFERAAELAGALSAAVAAGLRLYVEKADAERKRVEMHTVELEVDEGQVVTTKRFTGRQLLRYEESEGPRATTFRVYVTANGQYAVHQRNAPNWTVYADPDRSGLTEDDPKLWKGDWWKAGPRTLRVFPDLASMTDELPAGLIDALGQAQQQPLVEDLDI